MVVQATPKNHPGGDHGALFNAIYQSDVGPLFIKKLPITKAPKLITRNNKNRINLLIYIFFVIFSLIGFTIELKLAK